jgi:hypothetical protein
MLFLISQRPGGARDSPGLDVPPTLLARAGQVME